GGLSAVVRAKTFWAEEDVDQVFSGVFQYLERLKAVLKRSAATDKGSGPCLPLVMCVRLTPNTFSSPDELLPADFLQHSPPSSCSSSSSPIFLPFNGLSSPTAPPACLASLPSMPQSSPLFWGQNPLKIPLLCGFKRLTAMPLIIPQEDLESWDVIYKAPCGLSLRNYGDVMLFLLATESYDILQVDFFTFNPSVTLDPPSLAGSQQPEQDLSRGAEPTPVELCVGDGGARPADFRYRKDRWPHGCFLSHSPVLFKACCDCTDGCSDAKRCACMAMTIGGRHYRHHRLLQPIPSGLFECGPWCGCDRARCQNRLVQRGIRVRLQVFKTQNRGWGVRCRDDLDRGTFVCIYAGVVLQRVPSPAEPQPAKTMRSDLPSDDEVEVVTEWLAPPVLEGRSNLLETPPPVSPSLHVPVIQRPSDSSAATTDRDEDAVTSEDDGVSGTKARRYLKRAATVDDVCFVDASREGNVSRFINHSCQPNLFIQNVFTDSHDPAFPVIAFFTSRTVSAGTELTWDYSATVPADSPQKQEVPCLCGSDCTSNAHNFTNNTTNTILITILLIKQLILQIMLL
uniref:Histone-lysine N-methyltransferase SETDB2 n=1 Tax=Amphilophus citrinellus TaxID=61819 RepID=A0A3Q0RP08_AMPCI